MPLLDNRNRGVIYGLSKKQPVPPLLSNFRNSSPAKSCNTKSLKVPKPIDDPPQSTEDEDSQLDIESPNSGAETPQSRSCAIKTLSDTRLKKRSEVTGLKPTKVDNSSSEDDLATRGDIQSTSFTKAKKGEASQWTTRIKRKEPSAGAERDTNPQIKRQRRDECVSEKRRGGVSPTAPTNSGEHSANAHVFIKKKKPKMTYKKRSQSSQEAVTKKGT